MTTVILVSLLAPIAAGALLLVARHRLPKLVADARGIALQTVIVIVVMLAIAGAVAAVLLSTGSEVTSDLESADLSAACGAVAIIDDKGQSVNGRILSTAGNGGVAGGCQWDAGSGDTFSAAQCASVSGTLNGGGSTDQHCNRAP